MDYKGVVKGKGRGTLGTQDDYLGLKRRAHSGGLWFWGAWSG